MIFAAIGLLAAAAVLLIIGIVSSSVGPLVVAVLCTLAAGLTLLGSFRVYREEAAAQPGYPDAYRGSAPVATAAPAAPYVAAPAAAPAGGGVAVATWRDLVPASWDHLSGADAIAVVEGLSVDELHAVRRHELEGAARAEVIAAVDARLDTVMAVRRRL